MTTASRLMAAGMPPGQAVQIASEAMTGTPNLIANGTSFAAGTSLTASFSIFGTVASGGIAILPPAEAQPNFAVFNNGSNTLTVDPQATEFINAGSVGVGFSVTAGKGALFIPGKNLGVTPSVGAWIAVLSA
jgi:hypothetical protein